MTEWVLPGTGQAEGVGATMDGGLTLAGRAGGAPRVVHLNADGKVVDDWTMPGSDSWPRAIATPPGAVAIVAGPSDPPGHEHGIAVWRLQLGADGHLKQDWMRRFRRTSLDGGTGAVALDDGGLVVVGWTGGPQGGAWILRLDVDGESAWRRLALPTETEGLFHARAAALSPTGDVLVAAYGAPGPTEPGGVWVMRFDLQGKDYDQKVIDEAEDEHPEALAAYGDGGLAVAGWTLPVTEGIKGDKETPWVVRLNGRGDILWDHHWGGAKGRLNAVAALADGGVLVAGELGGEALLARLDITGAVVWERRLGKRASLRALTLLADGTAAAVGDKQGRMWVVKVGY
ncbi:MAG: hypothetical protein H7Y60_07465 [Rhodospirillaceae bacterium]|nr:hypothetical protein [Rhodospirillales bacterium]